MHYWDSKNTYDNIHMKNYSQNNLPMDEFAKGNVSQAHKSIDTYREYIAKCITSLTHQNTWGEENISDYLDKKLVELEKQHKEWTEKKTKAIQEKQIIQKEINKEKNKERKQDSKIKKLFEWIYTLTESYEFEKYCENLWDIDANKYWEITWAKGKKLLTQIYQSMDEEEQTTIKNDYNSQWLDSITQNIETQKVKTEDKQLKLYNFAPIYNNEWYIEKISTHIESLIGKLEFKQKRKLEDIARQMLTEQWNNNYIHTDREISPLLEQEFIKRIKESRWGKTLSLKLKKIKEKLLPDINERITETKKTNKEDII